MGSIEDQRERRDLGRAHFECLLEPPPSTEDLAEILDEAAEFRIDRKEYADGLALHRRAPERRIPPRPSRSRPPPRESGGRIDLPPPRRGAPEPAV